MSRRLHALGGRRPMAATAGLLAAVATVAGCSADDQVAEAGSLDDMEPVVLKLAEFNPENGALGRAWTHFQDQVTEDSNGKITFEDYWSSSLLGATDSLSGIGDGVADLGTIIPAYFPTELPVTSWLSGLGNATSSSTAHALAAGGAAAYELTMGTDLVTEEYAGRNLKILTTHPSPPYTMLCVEPVDDEAAAEGKRVRTSGPAWTATAEAIGMTAVNVALDELFESMQRGVVDCSVQNPTGWMDFGLTELATHYVPVTFAQISGQFVMNLDTWNSLPVEARQIIHDAMAETTRFIWDGYLASEAGFAEFLGEDGPISVDDVSELDPLAQAQRAAAVRDLPASAPAGIDDPQAVVDEYLADLETWTAVLVDNGYPVPEKDPEATVEMFRSLPEVDLDEFFNTFKAEVVDELRPE